MRAGWAEGPQAEPDEGTTFQRWCWAETGSQPLTRLPLFPLSLYCRLRTILPLLLLPSLFPLSTMA